MNQRQDEGLSADARAQGHRLRRGRFSEPGRIYLVTTVCRGRRPIFKKLSHGRHCVVALMRLAPAARTLCYVVMPDHMHWLMQLKGSADISRTVQQVKSLTSRSLHRLDPMLGPIWQRGFHDKAIRHDEALVELARYVVANPLRAGLTKSLRTYALWDAVWL